LVARLGASGAAADRWASGGLLGYVQAEDCDRASPRPPLRLTPRLLRRPGHLEAATLFNHDPGHSRGTTRDNICKLLSWRELCDGPLAPSPARALTHVAKSEALGTWLTGLAECARDAAGGARAAAAIARGVAGAAPRGPR